jgi:murein DD-endopeptidase MepM/ murein hydrolase activator NlpD
MRAAPDTLRPKLLVRAACLALLTLSLGCVDPWLQPSVPSDPPPGSEIEYRPAPKANRPKASPAPRQKPQLTTAPASIIETEPRTRSTVRYEPITREMGPIGEDHDALSHEAGDERPSDRAARPQSHIPARADEAGPHHEDDFDGHDTKLSDLALEDRPDRRNVAGRTVTPRTPKRPEIADPSLYEPQFTEDGIAFPYPTAKMFRGFGPCRGTRHVHEGIDLGGVGPDWGVGTPIRSMARAEVTFIGLGKDNPDDFGVPDRRDGEALRGDRLLPRSRFIAPYGDVYFFTRKKGRWRSGNVVVTKALEGPLAGHTIRYMHLGGVHPELEVGSVLEAGDELGLMGGTGVQESAPHLHLDITDPSGRRVDVAPLLGLPPTATCKKPAPEAAETSEVPTRKASDRSRLERREEDDEDLDETRDKDDREADKAADDSGKRSDPPPPAPLAAKKVEAREGAAPSKSRERERTRPLREAGDPGRDDGNAGDAPEKQGPSEKARRPEDAKTRARTGDAEETTKTEPVTKAKPTADSAKSPGKDVRDDKDEASGRENARKSRETDRDRRQDADGEDGRRPALRSGKLPLVKCQSAKRSEDFGSGRYAAHALVVDLEPGQVLTVEVVRGGGDWKPRLEVRGDGVDAKSLATGKIGGKAVSTVRAKEKTTIEVVISGWGSQPPKDASYALKVTEKCRRR